MSRQLLVGNKQDPSFPYRINLDDPRCFRGNYPLCPQKQKGKEEGRWTLFGA